MVAVITPNSTPRQLGEEEELVTDGKVRKQKKPKKEKSAKAKKLVKSPEKEINQGTPVSRTSSDGSEIDDSNARKSQKKKSQEMPASRTSSDGSGGSIEPVLGSPDMPSLDAAADGAGLSKFVLMLLCSHRLPLS